MKATGINHLALVVEDLDESIQFWSGTLGLKLARVEQVEAEGARVAFLPIGSSQIELVEPTQSDTGLDRFLKKRGPGFHHVCLEVKDLQASMDHLKEHGVELINPTPTRGADGRLYAFIHPHSAGGVLLELYQLPPQ
jgi:methylmalonyl-CoA/ethylmalonyl-CoA epimerase